MELFNNVTHKMKDRIIKFIEAEKLTAAEFADNIGVQRSSVSHVLNGRNNPSFAFIQKIIEHYPNLNLRWLMTGEGNIYENDSVVTSKSIKQQPKLFSTDSNPSMQKDSVITESDKNVDTIPENERSKVDTGTIGKQELPQRKVVKVLIFYDDQTFEDFRPAK